jgi:hypothetical protein
LKIRPARKIEILQKVLHFQKKMQHFSFLVSEKIRPTSLWAEEVVMSDQIDSQPRPSDAPFLFCMLLCARKAKDRMMESLARDWLAEAGIRIVFADELDSPRREGGRRHA